MRARTVSAGLILAAVYAAGCTNPGAATSPVPDSTFVRTMVELQRVSDDTLMDSTMRDSARHVILRRHGLSTDRLVQAARAMASDPDRAIQVWKAIDSGRYNLVPTRSKPASPPIGHPTTPSRPQP